MSSIRGEKIKPVSRKAQVIRDHCLRERQEAQAIRISANADVRRSWKDADNYNRAMSVSMPIILGEMNERKLQQTPTWFQCLSSGISRRVHAVANRFQMDRPEGTTYVMNLVYRIASGG
jgi:hypothetical protein